MAEKPRLDLWSTDHGRELMAEYLGYFAWQITAIRAILYAWHGPIRAILYWEKIAAAKPPRSRTITGLVNAGIVMRGGTHGNVINRTGFHYTIIDENIRNIFYEISRILQRRALSWLEDCTEFECDRALDLQEYDLTDLKANPKLYE